MRTLVAPDRDPAWQHLYEYVYLAVIEVVRAYRRDYGIPDIVLVRVRHAHAQLSEADREALRAGIGWR